MKTLIEYINECLILEAFKSDTVKEFYNKTKELCNNEELKNCAIVVASNMYNSAQYFYNMDNFKSLASELGLGKFKDEYLWKGKKEYANESGIYEQDEIIKMLGIKSKVCWTDTKENSLSYYCAKVPTMFIGIIQFGNDYSNYHYINKIHFGIFIDPEKGDDLIKYIKTHFKNKTDRKEIKKYHMRNDDWSFEDAIKVNGDIQKYLKQASDDQKELLKKIVNESQRGNTKYLADTKNWISVKEYERIIKQIHKGLKGEGYNANDWDTFTKTEAKNKLKMFRFNVTKLLCQPEESKLIESSWYNHLNDDAKKYVLNTYRILHKDLKELSDEDHHSIRKQMDKDWKNILTNRK